MAATENTPAGIASGTIIGRRGWKKSQMEIETQFGKLCFPIVVPLSQSYAALTCAQCPQNQRNERLAPTMEQSLADQIDGIDMPQCSLKV